jgi:transcriptional regulator with XRE-family HTH domain
MPRPNRPRSIASEDNLARRITYERGRRQMSYAGLAQRMTEVGCAIDQSALYKIEKGNPRRRISVDELVALSEVFAVPIDDLLAPPELAAEKVVLDVLKRYRTAGAALVAAREEFYGLLDEDEHVGAALDEYLEPSDLRFSLSSFRPAGPAPEAMFRTRVVQFIEAVLADAEKTEGPDLMAGLLQLRELTTDSGGEADG